MHGQWKQAQVAWEECGDTFWLWEWGAEVQGMDATTDNIWAEDQFLIYGLAIYWSWSAFRGNREIHVCIRDTAERE